MGTSSPTWAHLPLHGHIFPYMCRSSPTWAHLPLHGHIFPYMGTSSPSWAHLPLHGRIFPFMGTSSPTWAHLPLHGHIFPFMGTSSPTWAHLPLHGRILSFMPFFGWFCLLEVTILERLGWQIWAKSFMKATPSSAHFPLHGRIFPLHGHIFPFMGTSSPSWAGGKSGPKAFWRLPLHGHIFPFMGTSSLTWAHLPLHGHIFPFMGTSSPTWAHLPLHGHIFPFMGTSSPSPSWAHLPLHAIFWLILLTWSYHFGKARVANLGQRLFEGHPFMGTSSLTWAHLPLHGRIFPFMGTSSPTWAHLPLHGRIFPFMPFFGWFCLLEVTILERLGWQIWASGFLKATPSWAHLPLHGHIFPYMGASFLHAIFWLIVLTWSYHFGEARVANLGQGLFEGHPFIGTSSPSLCRCVQISRHAREQHTKEEGPPKPKTTHRNLWASFRFLRFLEPFSFHAPKYETRNRKKMNVWSTPKLQRKFRF